MCQSGDHLVAACPTVGFDGFAESPAMWQATIIAISLGGNPRRPLTAQSPIRAEDYSLVADGDNSDRLVVDLNLPKEKFSPLKRRVTAL